MQRYTQVWISAWNGRSAAGDAAATWQAVDGQKRCLQHDATWGWIGRCTADQTALGLSVVRPLRPYLHGRLAIGFGTSKGSLASLPDMRIDLALPGALTPRIAAELRLGTYLPCACAAACSTGLACLLAGADALERDQADSALVGASEASLAPLIVAGFANAGVLCGQTPPNAFAQPTGFAPAEGAAGVVLDRRPAAWRLIAGVRLGDAGHETHFVDPATLHTALTSLWAALPEPDLIVCHATGTAAGDAYELAELNRGPWRAAPRITCKPWIGHTLGASGVVELTAALHSPAKRLWKLSLGFGGHLIAVACQRE